MFDKWYKKEKPIQGLTGMGGGVSSRSTGGGPFAFVATGGTKSGPTGGYFYHVYDKGQNTSFVVESGEGTIEVMLQGGGGNGGQGRGSTTPTQGGGGGGGGATGVWNALVSKGSYPVYTTGGPGPSRFGPNPDGLRANGGGNGGPGSPPTAPGGSGGTNDTNLAGASITGDYSGNAGGNGSFGGSSGAGAAAGGYPQPNSLWWRPYISPGAGQGNEGAGNPGDDGNDYGGGASGGGGGQPLDGGGAGPGKPGGSGGGGRCVIRYPDAI